MGSKGQLLHSENCSSQGLHHGAVSSRLIHLVQTPPTETVTYEAKPSTALETLAQENGALTIDGALGGQRRIGEGTGGRGEHTGGWVEDRGALAELDTLSTEQLAERAHE